MMEFRTAEVIIQMRDDIVQIKGDVAEIKVMLAAIVDEGSDKAMAKQLAAIVSAKTKALQDAIPK